MASNHCVPATLVMSGHCMGWDAAWGPCCEVRRPHQGVIYVGVLPQRPPQRMARVSTRIRSRWAAAFEFTWAVSGVGCARGRRRLVLSCDPLPPCGPCKRWCRLSLARGLSRRACGSADMPVEGAWVGALLLSSRIYGLTHALGSAITPVGGFGPRSPPFHRRPLPSQAERRLPG